MTQAGLGCNARRMSEIVIRPARPDDAPALSEMGSRSFLETFVDGFGIPYPKADLDAFMEDSWSAAAFSKKLDEPGAAWWVAERDSAILAFANVGPNGLPHPEAKDGETELRRLYVDRTAQGLGLGTKLLKLSLDWMAAHTTGAQWIGVWSGNLKAQKLYEAYGFEKAGEYQYPVGSWLDDEFILRRG